MALRHRQVSVETPTQTPNEVSCNFLLFKARNFQTVRIRNNNLTYFRTVLILTSLRDNPPFRVSF